MKRLILSLFVVLLGATSAMGQGYTACQALGIGSTCECR